jgi:cysteinyl-tRNA synthetase
MSLVIYNTFAKGKQLFKTIEPRLVKMYTCGPTVYSHPHIGNFRSFIASDVLRRYLEYMGYEVQQVVNITDVGHMTTDDQAGGKMGEDKMMLAAEREKKSPYEIARFYEEEFLKLWDLLNLRPVYKNPRATEHIPEMIEIIKSLISKGFAYEVKGNVYFEVTKFKNYGKLSGNTLENLNAGARIEVNDEKKNPLDFALWKQDPNHIMQWDSPWPALRSLGEGGGRGFPGWHVECSAMSMKYLGETIDIHSGGEDNIFPHHESEIAQSETANDKPFVNYWFHTRHLLVGNQKMSKSLGNFYTVKDILDKGFASCVLRYALMSVHYRQPLNFTFESLDAARSAIQRLTDFKNKLVDVISKEQQVHTKEQSEFVDKILKEAQAKFEAAMNDDLNISEALGAIFEMVREINKIELDAALSGKALRLLERFDVVLGVLTDDDKGLDNEVESLIKERQLARKNKDYKKSDEIRDKLSKMGIILEDTPAGIRWKRKI